MKRTSLVLIVILLAAGACSRPDSLSGMELRNDGDGAVEVHRDGETIDVESTLGLEPGDVIVTKEGASARFALEGGEAVRRASLLENSQVIVQSPTEVEAESGNILLDVKADTTVAFDDVSASATRAVFRLDRGFGSSRVGSYVGEVGLEAIGQSALRVASYYQATVVAGDLPGEAVPYQLRTQDAWDQSILAAVVELERELQDLARGLQTQLTSDRPTLRYFNELAGGDSVRFMKPYLKRKPADLLIGFTIARNASLAFDEAFTTAFELYDDGARWSVASAILDAKPKPVVAQLTDLILGTGVVAAGDGSGGDGADFSLAAAEAGASGQPPASGDDPSTRPPNDDDPGGQDPGGEDPKPKDPDDPPQECESGAECDLQDLADELTPDEDPTPPPDPESTPEAESEQNVSDVIDGAITGGR